MTAKKILLTTIILEVAIIFAIGCAARLGFPLFGIFYNLGYGLVISTAVPLYWIYRHDETLADLGIKKLGLRQIIVLIVFTVFFIYGYCIPVIKYGLVARLRYDLLVYALLPLIMTTFFEEFLFHGFLQTRFEKAWGVVPAVLLSGLCFSLYHLGYPGFRHSYDLLRLLAVGIGFALAFKLAGNNIVVSYLVNLPNALATYTLKRHQFPDMGVNATIYAAVTILLIVAIFVMYKKRAFKGVT